MSGAEVVAPKSRGSRRLLWNTAGVAVALVAMVATLVLWAGSDQFQNMVRNRLAQQLQAVTGGRVEIASFHWHLLQLEAVAGGVVIHGDEPAGEAPYAQVQSMRVRLSVMGLWSPRILLRDLEIVRPQMHMIFYPDGATNQPHPARVQGGGRSGLETLFDLQAGHIAVNQGDLDIDNRAAALDVQNRYQPLDFDGDDVSVVMQYVAPQGQTPERYHVEAGIRDLNLMRGGELREIVPPVHGVVHASLDLTRDTATLAGFTLTSAMRGSKDRTLNIAGTMSHFAHPRWQATLRGDVDLRLLDPALGYSFTPEGIARLDLVSAGQDGTFRVDGTVRIDKGAYIASGVVLRGVDLSTRVHADPGALRVTSVVAHLPQGGEMTGEVLLTHWLPPSGPEMEASTPTTATAQGPATTTKNKFGLHASKTERPAPNKTPHSVLVKNPIVLIPVEGKVNAEFRNVAVDTVLDAVGQPPFQRIGVNALLNGPANATWDRGDVNTLSVKGTLKLSPAAQMLAGDAPATGALEGTYTQRDGAVDLRAFEVNLPSSRMSAHGKVGAFPLTSPTAINVDIQSSNLREFDAVLRDLGLTRNGKTGAAALPVSLSGEAQFHGIWAGSLASPRLAGNLKASQIALELPPNKAGGVPQTIRWDTVEANGTYDAEHIAILHSQLRRGAAQIDVDGTLVAATSAPISGRLSAQTPSGTRGDEMPAFDASSLVHAHVRATKVATTDLMPLAGVDLPITGSLDAQIEVDGPVRAPAGSGWAQLTDAVVYGEPVSSARAQGSLANDVLKLNSFDVHEKAGTVTGSGSYELQTQRFQLEAHGLGVDVAKIERLHTMGETFGGKLDFAASASGTRDDPKVEGHAAVAGLTVDGRALGTLNIKAQTIDRALHYDASSNFESATLALHGQTELRGAFQTQAKLDFSHFDIAALFKIAHMDAISAQSSLSGSAQIAGPLAHLDELRGDLRLQEMAVVIAAVRLKSDGGIHAVLDHARLTLDSVHVMGDETDLHAQGTLELKDTQRLDFAASGSVNLKLVESLDHNLTAAGISTFRVEAHGPLANPGLRGEVQFQNGSLSLEDLPNGLSQLRGTLEFSQNRLEIKSLTAMTGGGQLSIGGYLAYLHGIYADVSVTGQQIRIRYPQGVSSLADANLHVQGTQANMLLSGNVLITRFSLSPDLDVAALAAQAITVPSVAPPDAPSNHVRLDVRVQSSPQLNFQNAYAKLAGDVDLRLRGTVASPSLLGRISITEGNATIAGTRYELQRGDVTFNNPVRIQPSIDLNATARVADYDITLGLHGTPPDKMSVTYRSDPPLPEVDVVALLALGRTQSEQGLYTQQQQQSVGTSPSTDVLLGGALNATVSSRVQKLFGAGSVKVDPSYLGALGNSTTRITVEEQVGKDVTLRYATNVDTSAQQLIQAEIAINRHVSVQVTRDESGVFSMVIKAIRRYR